MRLGQPSTNRMTIDVHFELNSALNQGVRLIRSYPLLIRHAARSERSEPSRWAQFVQLDQRKRPTSDFASASHAEGRWFDPRLTPTRAASDHRGRQ